MNPAALLPRAGCAGASSIFGHRVGMACIHLVRHLATEGAPATWLDRAGLQAWFDVEGARGITAGSRPSGRLVAAVAASRHLLVSPLERAQATARSVLARGARRRTRSRGDH